MLQGIPLKCKIEAKSCLVHIMLDESTLVVMEVICLFSKNECVCLFALCVMYIDSKNKLTCMVILGQNLLRIELGTGTIIIRWSLILAAHNLAILTGIM